MPKVIHEIWGSRVKLFDDRPLLAAGALIREMESAMQHELGPKSFGMRQSGLVAKKDRKRKSVCESEFEGWAWRGVAWVDLRCFGAGTPGLVDRQVQPRSIGSNRGVRLAWRPRFVASTPGRRLQVRSSRCCNKSPSDEGRMPRERAMVMATTARCVSLSCVAQGDGSSHWSSMGRSSQKCDCSSSFVQASRERNASTRL